jgi:hypothetical protein
VLPSIHISQTGLLDISAAEPKAERYRSTDRHVMIDGLAVGRS